MFGVLKGNQFGLVRGDSQGDGDGAGSVIHHVMGYF